MTQSLIENSKIYFPKDDVQSLRDIMGFQFDMNRHCSGNRPKTCSLSVTQWWMRNHVIISMTVNMDSVYPQNKAYDHSYIHILHSRLSFFLFDWITYLMHWFTSEQIFCFFGDEKNEMKEDKLYQKPKAEYTLKWN